MGAQSNLTEFHLKADGSTFVTLVDGGGGGGVWFFFSTSSPKQSQLRMQSMPVTFLCAHESAVLLDTFISVLSL